MERMEKPARMIERAKAGEIVSWLAGLSRDTYLNRMGRRAELDRAFALARAAGLWRLDHRRR
jgi:hypothetical protein